ncbi:MAG: tyrosine-type recombinase/integrase [Neisseriaceae bacterium]
MPKIKNNTKKLKNDIILQDNDQDMDILQFITKYTDLYINNKQSENLSKYTLRNIVLVLERFYQFIADEFTLDNNLTLHKFNRYFLNNYLLFSANQGLSPNSQKLHLTIIKNFLTFICDDDIKRYGFLRSNISGTKIKTEHKEKAGFSQTDQKLIIKLLQRLDKKQSYMAQRKSLIIKILLFTGIRASELIEIKWSNINEIDDNKHGLLYSILIKGKGNKERFAYIKYDIVSKNLAFVKKHSGNYERVFVTTQGNIMKPNNLYTEIKAELFKNGITKAGIHIFRHTFARNLVGQDVNLATIKDLLGHSNITVTAQFYAKSDENAKKNALFKNKL